MGYSKRYYNRHLVQYQLWENAIGASIVETFKPNSILDLGCGVGSYLEGALNAGCPDVLGIEFSFDAAKDFFVDSIRPFIHFGDVTSSLNIGRKFDCVISFEVGEHIDPSGTSGFIDNLVSLSNKHIVMTAAPPGQAGTGHINLREKQFWIDAIEGHGFQHQQEMVSSLILRWSGMRIEIPKTRSPQCDHSMKGAGTAANKVPDYILRNLMVFQK